MLGDLGGEQGNARFPWLGRLLSRLAVIGLPSRQTPVILSVSFPVAWESEKVIDSCSREILKVVRPPPAALF